MKPCKSPQWFCILVCVCLFFFFCYSNDPWTAREKVEQIHRIFFGIEPFWTNEFPLKSKSFSLKFVLAVVFICPFSIWHFRNGKSKMLETQTHQRCFAQSMRSRFRTIVPWLIWVVLFEINAFTNVRIKALYDGDITRAMHTAHAAYAMQTKASRS